MEQYKETNTTILYKALSDFVIFNAGYEKCESGHTFGPAFRKFNIIHFVMDGKGELTIDNQIFQLSYQLIKSLLIKLILNHPGHMFG